MNRHRSLYYYIIFFICISIANSAKVEFVHDSPKSWNMNRGLRLRSSRTNTGQEEMLKNNDKALQRYKGIQFSKTPTTNEYFDGSRDPELESGSYDKVAVVTHSHPIYSNRYHQLLNYYYPQGTGVKGYEEFGTYGYGYDDNNQGLMRTRGKTVNLSAVSLLGVLALMGMIQHVMMDLDASAMSSMQNENFETGVSISGQRPRPPPRPIVIRPTQRPLQPTFGTTQRPIMTARPIIMTTTTTSRPLITIMNSNQNLNTRIKRSASETNIILPLLEFSRVADRLLPLYMKLSKVLHSANENIVMLLRKEIHAILVTEFGVPESLSTESVRKSVQIMKGKFNSSDDQKWSQI